MIVVVSGALANKPGNGGAAWTRLSWALGFRKLGFEVHFLEQLCRDACVDEDGTRTGFEQSANLAYFRRVTGQMGLPATLVYEGGEQVYGMPLAELLDLAAAAGLLVNITGQLSLGPLLRRFRRKVYIDLDPGYTQFWHAGGQLHVAGHDHYYTVGENIGTPGCPVPVGDIAWRPIRQPVVLEEWPAMAPEGRGDFTTVGSWRGAYGPVQWGGRTFGVKAHEFRKFLELPERTGASFEIALDIHHGDARDHDLLRGHGWRLADPRAVAGDPPSFRSYVQRSGAEFSTAQGIYVETGSGWFSDRTVRYLASGKPALVQDTGFSRNYPVGDGLLTYRTLDEAAAGVAEIRKHYPRHAASARALAEEYFDSNIVLRRLVDEIGV